MTALALFASTFILVMALGLQSLNVNRGHYVMAFLTSLFIGGSQWILYKVVPGETTGPDLVAYLFGGPFGIVTAMWLHPRITRCFK